MARTQKIVLIADIEVVKGRAKKPNLDTEGGELLVESVGRQGMLQPPMVQAPRQPGGKYPLVFGHRRYFVAKKLGLKEILVTVDDSMTDAEAEYATLAENLFRQEKKDPNSYRQNLTRWWALHKAAFDSKGKSAEALETNGRPKKEEPAAEEPEAERKASPGDAFPKSDDDEEETEAHEDTESGEDTQEPEQPRARSESFLDDTTKRFSKKIREATGCSEAKARYDAAIAKAFTEEQLNIIAALNLTERVVRDLAMIKDENERSAAIDLIMSGKDPAEAIAECKGKLDAIRKNTKEENLSDGEWLDKFCGEVRNRVKNKKAFDTAAILYRKTRIDLAAFANRISHPLKCARLNKANDSLTRLLSMVCAVQHPSQWLVCGVCSGEGNDADLKPCVSCTGNGFKILSGGQPKK